MQTSRAHVIGNLTYSDLIEQNPVVPAGHLVIPSNFAINMAVGDGTTRWADLPVFVGSGGGDY